jgi:hypothetical protein
MDLEELKKCKNEDDFSALMMEDVLGGYNQPDLYPDHKKIAIVDHAANYSIEKIKSFFEKVHSELKVKFWVGDVTTVTIEGKVYNRHFLYSDEEPLISSLFTDGIFRLQEPVVERPDGISIDLKGLKIIFNNMGEVLKYGSADELQVAVTRILDDYLPGIDNPDIAIRDSVSRNSRTKWMVESFSDYLMSLDTQKEKIDLLKNFEKHIPGLRFKLSPDRFIPFLTAHQLATHMNGFEPGIQDEIINKLILNFGFFDNYSLQ